MQPHVANLDEEGDEDIDNVSDDTMGANGDDGIQRPHKPFCASNNKPLNMLLHNVPAIHLSQMQSRPYETKTTN
jgi:hypothetical protein